MKIIVSILALIVLFGCISDKNEIKDTDLTKRRLYGNIKSIKTTNYRAIDKFGEIFPGEIIDGAKTITYSLDWFYESNELWTGIYSHKLLNGIVHFNIYGNVIEESDSSFRHLFKYNSDGQIIQEKYFTNIGYGNYRIEYVYNEFGKLIEQNLYNYIGEFHQKTIFKYNDNGQKIQVLNYNSNGDLINKTIEEINIEKVYDSNGFINSTTKYNFSSNGMLREREISIFESGSKKRRWVITIEYDNIGNVIEVKELNDTGWAFETNTFAYDEKGNLINKTEVFHITGKKDEVVWTYEYAYDHNGNWTRQISYADQVLKMVTERVIEYYGKKDFYGEGESKTSDFSSGHSGTFDNQINNGNIPGCYEYKYDPSLDNYLVINVGAGTDVALKLISHSDNKCIRFVYVENSSSILIKNIPQGKYYAKIAYGKNWVIEPDKGVCQGRFSRNMFYEKGLDTLDYYLEKSSTGYSIPSYRLSLDVISSRSDNSFISEVISEDDFFE